MLQPVTIAAHPESISRNGSGTVTISYDDEHAIRIIDGQHRRQAIHQLLDKQAVSQQTEGTDWTQQEIGVTLYIEEAPKKMRQMFADMAEAKAIDRATKVRFDTTDPFNNIAQSVENEAELVKNRLNTNRPTTQVNKDEFLMTSMELKEIVSILTTGKTIGKPTGQMRMEYSTKEKEEESLEMSVGFLDEFLPKIHEDFSQILNGDMSLTEISLRRQNNLLLYPQVMTFLARCYEATDGDERSRMALQEHLTKQTFEKDTHVREDGEGLLKQLELVNMEMTHAGRVTLLRKSSPEWGNRARELVRTADRATQDRTTSEEE